MKWLLFVRSRNSYLTWDMVSRWQFCKSINWLFKRTIRIAFILFHPKWSIQFAKPHRRAPNICSRDFETNCPTSNERSQGSDNMNKHHLPIMTRHCWQPCSERVINECWKMPDVQPNCQNVNHSILTFTFYDIQVQRSLPLNALTTAKM
jgi:hypothetical protein